MKKPEGISLFFPAFNEEDNIGKLLLEADQFLKNRALNYELIVVNDGSQDKTTEIVQQLAKKNPKIKLVNHPKNLGYGAALKTGFRCSKFPWIAFIDSDGQFDIEELEKFLQARGQTDLLMGYRMKRRDSLFRRFLARTLWLVDWWLFGINYKDVDCGFKLFKKEILKKIGELKTQSAITETEFVLRTKRAGFKIKEIGVAHHPREKGEQTGGKFRIVTKAALEGLWLRLLLWQENLQSSFFRIKDFIKRNRIESIILFFILLLATFLRTYRLRSHLIFLGDEGRDALTVKRIIVDRKLTLLGPTASVGGFYLGPIYYYFMILPLWLAGFDPVGPAVMVAVFGILTVFFVWLLSRPLLGKKAALITTLFYGVSAKVVYWTRFSWNPNTMPFFSVLFLCFLYKGVKNLRKKFFFLAGASLGILWQLHYLSLALIPVLLAVIFLLTRRKYWLKSIFASVLGAITTFSPFLVFELRHNFPNTRTIINFFIERSGAVQGFKEEIFINAIQTRACHLLEIILMLTNWEMIKVFLALSLFFLIVKVFQKGKIAKVIFLWWFIGTATLSLYQGQMYEYYYGFLFPLPAIFLGLIGSFLLKRNWFFKASYGVFVLLLLLINLRAQPFQGEGANLIEQTKRISQMVIELAEKRPFNFALMARGNSDHSYRYFLELWNFKPVSLEEQVTEQLIIVCEEKECEPLGHPLWEIAGFGRAEIDRIEEHPVGIKVMRLVHHPDSIDLIGKPVPKGK